MRNFVLLILSILLFTACSDGKKNKRSKSKEIPTYTIGINLPLTGNASYFAEEVRKGMELAFDHFNDSSRQVKLNVLFEDNKFNPKDAISIARKFIDVDGIDIYITGYTPIIQATTGLVDKRQIPILLTLSSAELIAEPYAWAFRDFSLESDIMPMLASYAYEEMGLKSGSWLVINDDMGLDAVKFFGDRIEALGGNMEGGEVFEVTETDLRNKISKVLEHQPEFILVAGRGSAMINALRQIREMAPELPLFSNNTVDNEKVWSALGKHAADIYFPRTFTDTESRLYKKASKQFNDRYGRDMNWLNIYGLSTANYIVRGLKETGGDKEAMRDYLATLDVKSLRGRLVMNEKHDVIVPQVVYTRSDGRSVRLTGIESETKTETR